MARMIRDADGNRVVGYKEWCGGSERPGIHVYRFPNENPKYRKYDAATCPFCFKVMRLRKDGTLRLHGRYVS